MRCGEIASLSGAGDDPRYFGVALSLWLNWSSHRLDTTGGALVDERGNVIGIVSAKVLAHGHQ
jgi:hypothetical protein